MKSKRSNNKRGGISVFLLMLFLSLTLLVSSFVNAAGFYAGESYSNAAFDLGGRSVLAEYYKPLQESYGIFGVKGDQDSISEKLYMYAKESIYQSPLNQNEKTFDPLGLCVNGVTVDLKDFSLLDVNNFESQVLEQMKYRILIPKVNSINVIAEEINRGALLIELTKKAIAIFQRFAELEPILTLVFNAHEKIAELETQLKKALMEEKGSEEEILEKAKELAIISVEIRKNYELLLFNLIRLKNTSKNMLNVFNDFEDFIRNPKNSLGTTVGKEVEQKVAAIKNILNDLNNVDGLSYETAIEMNTKLLENFEAGLKTGSVDTSTLILNYNWGIDFMILRDILIKGKEDKDKKQMIKEIINVSNQSSGHLKDQPEDRVLKNQKVIKGLPSAGLLQQDEFLISFNANLESLFNMKEQIEKGVNNIQVNEYILRYMANRQSELGTNRFFSNEVEYILYGNKSDSKNYTEFENNFLILRTGLNMVHIFSNPQKMKEVSALAAAITPGPWALATELLIITAWATVEAENDLKLLEDKTGVALIKKESDWAISIDSLINGGLKNIIRPKEAANGLLYEDYLRLFLLIEPREVKLLRTMDLIQINIKGNNNENFSMKEYYCGFDYHAFITKRSILPKLNKFWLDTIEISGTQLY